MDAEERLRATAPALYRACLLLVTYHDSRHRSNRTYALDMARAALALAGPQPDGTGLMELPRVDARISRI